MTFHSFAEELQPLLITIIGHPLLHTQWLNTLSFWENCGARKLASCQHPTKVKEEMLKHASEEFRHAYYLKQQMYKVGAIFLGDYRWDFLLGENIAYHYLNRLEHAICKFLKQNSSHNSHQFRVLAYLLVTYAIECRAEEVYTLYAEVLRKSRSPVRVQSILLEEKEHLAEIQQELASWPEAIFLCQVACQIEKNLFTKWLAVLKQSLLEDKLNNRIAI